LLTWSCIFSLFITLFFKKVACTSVEAVTLQALSAAQPRPPVHGLCCCLTLSSKEPPTEEESCTV